MPRQQQDGEVAALYAAHRLSLVRLAVLLGEPVGSAESLVQRAFLRLLRTTQHTRRGVDPGDALASLRRAVVGAGHAGPRAYPAPAAPPTPGGGPPGAALPTRQRQALVLALWAGLSDRQVARCLATPDPAAAALRREAVAALQAADEPAAETQERLAEALQQAANRVSPLDLRSSYADVLAEDQRIRARRRRTGLTAVAAVGAVAVAAAGISFAAAPRGDDSASPTVPTPAVTGTPTITPLSSPALAPGEQPRSAVPWSQVGTGWVAVAAAAPADAITTTLMLVAPEGTRYAVGTSPDGLTLFDISPDGRKALVAIGTEGFEWDIAAGTSRRLGTAFGWKTLHYAGPADAGYLVLWVDSTSQLRLERRNPDGRLRADYPVAFAPLAGSPGTPSAVVSGDGRTAFVASRDGGVLVVDLMTDAVGTVRLPEGSSGCYPRDRTGPQSVLVSCRTGPSPLVVASAVTSMVQPVTGVPAAVSGAWPSTLGTLVQVGDECSTELALVGPAGITRIRPGGAAAGLVPNQTVGDTLLLGGTRCGNDGSRLVAYDTHTDSSTELAGDDAGGRAVRQAVVVRPVR